MSKIKIKSTRAQIVESSLHDMRKLSWLKYWEDITGENADTCSYLDCSNKADIGGHLFLFLYSQNNTYIAPICFVCKYDKNDGEFHDMKMDITYVKMTSLIKAIRF
jgi:hypothetical protein